MNCLSCLLSVKPFDISHTGQAIQNEFETTIEEYEITNVYAVNADDASNNNKLKESCRYFVWRPIHINNLLIKDVIREFDYLKHIIRDNNKIVKRLKLSFQAQNKLMSLFQKHHHAFKRMPSFSKSRFNSMFEQFNYIVTYQKELMEFSSDYKQERIKFIEQFLPFIKYVNESNKLLSTENKPTFHYLYMTIIGMKTCVEKIENGEGNHCDKEQQDREQTEEYDDDTFDSFEETEDSESSDEEYLKDTCVRRGRNGFWEYLKKKIEERLEPLLEDRRVRMAYYLNPETRVSMKERDISSCRTYYNSRVRLSKQQASSVSSSLPSFFHSFISANQRQPATTVSFEYEKEVMTDREEYSSFMRRMREKYEGINELYAEFSFIPSSSIPCERIFSQMGNICTKDRFNLNQTKICRLLKIKMALCKEKKIKRKEFYKAKK